MMLCDECHEREAEIKVTAVDAKGELNEKHLCKECAAKKGYESTQQKPLYELFTDLLKESVKDEDQIRCARCGMTWAEFRRNGRLGCQHCYTEFGSRVEQLLSKIHGTTRHTGRHSTVNPESTAMYREMEVARLRKELEKAIQDEDYEKAARLRDEVNKHEKRLD